MGQRLLNECVQVSEQKRAQVRLGLQSIDPEPSGGASCNEETFALSSGLQGSNREGTELPGPGGVQPKLVVAEGASCLCGMSWRALGCPQNTRTPRGSAGFACLPSAGGQGLDSGSTCGPLRPLCPLKARLRVSPLQGWLVGNLQGWQPVSGVVRCLWTGSRLPHGDDIPNALCPRKAQ